MNRLDDILVFAPLSDGALARVAQRAVQDLAKRASSEHMVAVTCSTAAARAIVEVTHHTIIGYISVVL